MAFGNTAKDGSGSAYWLLLDSDGRLQISGSAAHDAAANGNPVRIGGVYHATPPAVADGDAVDLLLTAAGRVEVVQASKSAKTATQITATGNLKASSGYLYGITITGVGVTAGDTVVLANGSGGTTIFTFAFSSANETINIPLPAPVAFSTAIHATITLTGGSAYITAIYD